MGKRLSVIYTKTGDTGETGLADQRRVPKNHPRIEAIGAVDSLNSQLGLLLVELSVPAALKLLQALLAPVQHRLFDLGGELAMPVYQALDVSAVQGLETLIDDWNKELAPLENFILPGGSRCIALAHFCRSSTREAERRCQTLHQQEPLRPVVLAYLNRLSDVFFVAARIIAQKEDIAEILWQAAPKPDEY